MRLIAEKYFSLNEFAYTTNIIICVHNIIVPVITWDDSQVTIPEGENRQVCYSSDIGTAQPYDVMVGAHEKGASPATQGTYNMKLKR